MLTRESHMGGDRSPNTHVLGHRHVRLPPPQPSTGMSPESLQQEWEVVCCRVCLFNLAGGGGQGGQRRAWGKGQEGKMGVTRGAGKGKEAVKHPENRALALLPHSLLPPGWC